jgi:hypothetical protein
LGKRSSRLHEVVYAVLKGNDHAGKEEAAPLHGPRNLLLPHHLDTTHAHPATQAHHVIGRFSFSHDMSLLLESSKLQVSPHDYYSADVPHLAASCHQCGPERVRRAIGGLDPPIALTHVIHIHSQHRRRKLHLHASYDI